MSEKDLPEASPVEVAPQYGGFDPEKGVTWKISEKKISAWIVTSLYLHYKPRTQEEAEELMEKKRIKFRQIEGRDGALGTLVNGKGKVIAQTPILNFIEYETGNPDDDTEHSVLDEPSGDGDGMTVSDGSGTGDTKS